MTKEQKLEKLKEKIIEVVPEIKKQVERDVALEDILKVLKHKNINALSNKWLITRWRFNRPLDQQPFKIIDFLYNLICK